MKYEANKPVRPYVSSLVRNSMFVVIGLVLGLYVGSLYVVAQIQDFAVSTVKQPSVVLTATPVDSLGVGVTHSTYGDLQPAETVQEVQ